MVSDKILKSLIDGLNYVLILVLMEDGLWLLLQWMISQMIAVLILVLMEDGLWQRFLQLADYQHVKEIDFTNFNWFLKYLLKIFSPVNIYVAKL